MIASHSVMIYQRKKEKRKNGGGKGKETRLCNMLHFAFNYKGMFSPVCTFFFLAFPLCGNHHLELHVLTETNLSLESISVS